MRIDPITHKVDPESIENVDQAMSMVIFLESECLRHVDDITPTKKLIKEIRKRWDL